MPRLDPPMVGATSGAMTLHAPVHRHGRAARSDDGRFSLPLPKEVFVMKTRSLAIAAAVAAAFAAPAAFATNGYFPHGQGIKAKGMAGAAIALPQDAIAAATNPAGMFFVGNRIDVGLDWFKPTREAQVVGSCFNPPACTANANGTYDANDKSNFFVPEFGYNRLVSPNVAVGVTVYGHGGMNTSYTSAFPLFGTSKPGVDLSQLFVAPTVAWQVAPGQVIGASVNLAYQRFKATGLENFDNPVFSAFPGNVTNQGYDSSTGVGVRIGWMGKLAPACDFGVTYQTKTKMSEFDKYKGLFAEEGGFDIPANYGAGVACKVAPQVTVAFDVVRIEYSGIRSVNNRLQNLLNGQQLGTANGAGFGWQDVTAYKLGVQWAVNPTTTLRAGYNYGKQPIPSSETLFNVLAPGVVEQHYTVGGTWAMPGNSEASFFFMYVPEKTVNGSNSIPALFGGGNVNLRMKQMSLGVAYGWRF
jgi:long-chain fatty acid transport protein